MRVVTEGQYFLDLLVDSLARHTGTAAEQISPDQLVAEIPGMESVRLLRVLTEFEDEHGAGVPESFPFDVATVATLAEALALGVGDDAQQR